MKKIIALLLVLVISSFCFAGCEKTPSPDASSDNTSSTLEGEDTVEINERTETKKKITETVNIEPFGDVTFIHSETTTADDIQNLTIAKNDKIIYKDYEYTYGMLTTPDGQQADAGKTFCVKYTGNSKTPEEPYADWFGIPVECMDYCFYNNKDIEQPINMPLSITSASYCYYGCTGIKEVGDYLHYCENLTMSSYMFANCENLKSVQHMGNSIINAEGMFANCKNLTEVCNMPATIQTANKMFQNCTSLNLISGFNAEGLEYCDGIFEGTEQKININEPSENIKELLKEYKNVVFDEVSETAPQKNNEE